MVHYFKILLLLIFVTAPALDIAFLDSQESVDHYSESFHADKKSELGIAGDFHCICHILHYGTATGKISFQSSDGIYFKAWPYEDIVGYGLHPRPGLRPPSSTLS